MNIEEVFKKSIRLFFSRSYSIRSWFIRKCLYYELIQIGLKVEKQKPLSLVYKEVKLDVGYRVDLLVEDSVIVELKSVEALCDIHMAIILTYLKLSGCKLGLLANFNVLHLKDGIKRVIL